MIENDKNKVLNTIYQFAMTLPDADLTSNVRERVRKFVKNLLEIVIPDGKEMIVGKDLSRVETMRLLEKYLPSVGRFQNKRVIYNFTSGQRWDVSISTNEPATANFSRAKK